VIGWAPLNSGAIHWEFMLQRMQANSFVWQQPAKIITDTGMFLEF
jgi:hypothetical protein